MKLSQKEVEHVAALARLDLTPAEKKKFTEQLSDVLTYVGQLKKVDTESVEPTSQVTDLLNVARVDESFDCDQKIQSQILKNVPEKDGAHIKVKGVFEE